MNILFKTRCYLMGAMENFNGTSWRDSIKKELSDSKITFFDPYHKPFINEIREDEEARKELKSWMVDGNYDKVSGRMKNVRAEDLRLCDLSDFGIVHIIPEVPTWGTVEELAWFVRCKKPLFIFVSGGKSKTPLWIMGMVPHSFIFDSLEDIIKTLKNIDSGKAPFDSSRWRLLTEENR